MPCPVPNGSCRSHFQTENNFWRHLWRKNQIAARSVGHAYLFTGPRGTGKTTVARIFARAVNCEHPVDGSPCGNCPSCVALANGSLDITEIDAASNNGVGEMRDLREKVQYPPVSGKYKVYIIDEVHMLTDSAFNALLKTLEEPPAHAIFILATTEPQKLPATILSRCMRLDFKLIPEEDLEKHLMRVLDEIGKPYEREAVAAIARAGAGSDRDMLSIAEMCIAYSEKLTYEGVTAVLGAADFHETCALVSCLLRADGGGALEKTELILSEGKAVGVLVRNLLDLLNQVLVAKTCASAERLLSLPKELFSQVKGLADGAEYKAILRATEILAKTESELRYTTSPRIVLETAILRVSCPAEDYDIEALLVRMNALERELKELKASGIRVEEKRTDAIPAAQNAPKAAQNAREESAPEPDYSFPEEEPIFEEAYFSDGSIIPPEPLPKAEQPKKQPAEPPAKTPEPFAAAPETPAAAGTSASESAPVAAVNPVAAPQDAQKAFGQFMRTLRKTSRSGVLFTMCSDLEAEFEGETLVLISDSETIVRSLKREEHVKIMTEVFSGIGIASFEVRGRAQTPKSGGIEELKNNFKDYPIEFK